MFPDVEDALIEILEPVAGDPDRIGTWIDENTDLPFILVNRTGGRAAGPFDTARVSVECLAETRAASAALTKQVRHTLVDARGVNTEAGFIDSIDEDLSPTPIPNELQYENVRMTSSNWVVQTRLHDDD